MQEAEGGKPSKGNSTAASIKREEERLNAEAAEVGAKIRATEAELRSLRSQHQTILDKLAQMHGPARGGQWEAAGGKAKQQVSERSSGRPWLWSQVARVWAARCRSQWLCVQVVRLACEVAPHRPLRCEGSRLHCMIPHPCHACTAL